MKQPIVSFVVEECHLIFSKYIFLNQIMLVLSSASLLATLPGLFPSMLEHVHSCAESWFFARQADLDNGLTIQELESTDGLGIPRFVIEAMKTNLIT